MTENIVFSESVESAPLEVDSEQGERKERIERLRRELAEARVDLDKAIIALSDLSSLRVKLLHREEYGKSLAVFQEASRRVRKICNALDNEFVTGEKVSLQPDISISESAERGQQESWERNIPRKNGQ